MYQYEYKTLHELIDAAATHNLSLSEVVVRHEMETSEQTEQDVRSRMEGRLAVFKESIDAGLNDTEKSVSGLVGGDADKLLKAAPKLLGPLAKKAAVYALAVSEANAKMFKIVACPTAGSCGIVPAVMTAVAEELDVDTETSVGTKTDCFQLHFQPFVLSAASHFLCTPQDWSKIAKSFNMHLTPLAQFFTTNLGKHLERIFYITYGKRTASMNHPAQFIRSHLTIQKNAGMQTFLFRIVGLTGILIPIVKYSH